MAYPATRILFLLQLNIVYLPFKGAPVPTTNVPFTRLLWIQILHLWSKFGNNSFMGCEYVVTYLLKNIILQIVLIIIMIIDNIRIVHPFILLE